MVIDNLYLQWSARRPAEANTISVVYPNAVLPFPVGDECFETVSGRHSQITKRLGGIKMFKLPSGNCPKFLRTRSPCGFCVTPIEHIFNASVGE